MSDIDWRDLQYLQALAKYKSLSQAAEKLNVNRTTVTRHIEQLERSLNTKLVERVGRSLVLTPSGAEVFSAVEGIDGLLHGVSREVYGRDQKMEGVLRITSPPGIAVMMGKGLAEFGNRHPELMLEINGSNAVEDLDNSEADIAIRLTNSPPEHLIGWVLGRPTLALYASKKIAAKLKKAKVIDYLAMDVDIGSDVIKSALVGDMKLVARSNSLDLLKEMVAAGRGVTTLPCYLAESDERLERISEPVKNVLPELWMLYHPRLKSRQKVKIAAEYIRNMFRDMQGQLEGS